MDDTTNVDLTAIVADLTRAEEVHRGIRPLSELKVGDSIASPFGAPYYYARLEILSESRALSIVRDFAGDAVISIKPTIVRFSDIPSGMTVMDLVRTWTNYRAAIVSIDYQVGLVGAIMRDGFSFHFIARFFLPQRPARVEASTDSAT